MFIFSSGRVIHCAVTLRTGPSALVGRVISCRAMAVGGFPPADVNRTSLVHTGEVHPPFAVAYDKFTVLMGLRCRCAKGGSGRPSARFSVINT